VPVDHHAVAAVAAVAGVVLRHEFEDHEPNFLLSDAQAVPRPHHCVSRVAKVVFTNLVTAARRLSTVVRSFRTVFGAGCGGGDREVFMAGLAPRDRPRSGALPR